MMVVLEGRGWQLSGSVLWLRLVKTRYTRFSSRLINTIVTVLVLDTIKQYLFIFLQNLTNVIILMLDEYVVAGTDFLTYNVLW